MKHNIVIICLIALSLAVVGTSCEPTPPNKPKFDETFLAGYWIEGTTHEYYNANGTGYTWDTADDVTEDEAQPFTWVLTGSTLTQNHKMEMGGIIPKMFTVSKLNASTLIYHDDYGTTHTFVKE